MSIGGIGPCEPSAAPGARAPESGTPGRGPLTRWWEVALLVCSPAAALAGTAILLWGETPASALLGSALLFAGLGTGFLVEVRRQRRIRAAGSGAAER